MLIAGNWKMNTTREEAVALARAIAATATAPVVDVVVCPPFVSLDAVAHVLSDTAVRVGAQDVSDEGQGAFTGEVSAAMLAAVGCAFGIVGHSERRQRHGETDALVARKAARLLAAGLTPIVCVGETLAERRAGGAEAVVGRQLDGALGGLGADALARVVVAYEPVWAIGTGETATPEQAQAVHAFIRQRLAARVGGEAARAIPVLYGGSMNERNAADLLARPDVDGGLVGGASLKAESFAEIVTAAGTAGRA